MRRVSVVPALALGLLLAVLGTPGRPAVASAAVLAGSADIAPLPATPADSVVDSYGVGVHLAFLDTPYSDATAVAGALRNLGVRHVRDDLFLDNPRQYAGIRTVAEQGVGFDLIMGRPTSQATPADYVRTVATQLPAGAVESLEGTNEWDISGRSNWVEEMKTWQQQLYTAAKGDPATAGMPVLSPALAFRWNYATAGDLSQYADEANGHMYPGGYLPSNEVSRITRAIRGSIPDKPLVTTESGYHNAMNTTNGHLPVPEDVAAVYMPRVLLEHYRRGERRVYTYELIDEFDDPGLTNPEAHFGLLRHDLSPKPAYTAMKTLLGLLSDPGPAFTPGSLAVTVAGFPADARYMLTQKRDGQFVLLLWRDVSVYDPSTQQPQTVTPASVTLRLAKTADLMVYRPTQSAAPVAGTQASSLPLQLDGEVTAITISPVTPAPAQVAATSGNRQATVTWGTSATAQGITGFEIRRTPGGLVSTLPPLARSYRDAGLVNGSRYTYTVRALSANGPSLAVAAPTVVPATVPSRPSNVRVVAGRRSVRVTWTKSYDGGRPVTGSRLVCGDRTVTVGPATRGVTLTAPRSGRFRVGVRARNQVGWGPPAYTRYVSLR